MLLECLLAALLVSPATLADDEEKRATDDFAWLVQAAPPLKRFARFSVLQKRLEAWLLAAPDARVFSASCAEVEVGRANARFVLVDRQIEKTVGDRRSVRMSREQLAGTERVRTFSWGDEVRREGDWVKSADAQGLGWSAVGVADTQLLALHSVNETAAFLGGELRELMLRCAAGRCHVVVRSLPQAAFAAEEEDIVLDVAQESDSARRLQEMLRQPLPVVAVEEGRAQAWLFRSREACLAHRAPPRGAPQPSLKRIER